MATNATSLLNLTSLSGFAESSLGVKDGVAFELPGVVSAFLNRKLVKRFDRRSVIRHVVETEPLLQSWELQIAGEFSNHPAWQKIFRALWGEEISTDLVTPEAGFTTYTHASRADAAPALFGFSAELPTGEVYRLKGATPTSLRLAATAQGLVTFELVFGVLQVSEGGAHVPAVDTYVHDPSSGAADVTVKAVFGTGAVLAGNSTDILRPATEFALYVIRDARPCQYQAPLDQVGEPTRWMLSNELDIAGTVFLYAGDSAGPSLQLGKSEGIFQVEIAGPSYDPDFTLTIPEGEFLIQEVPIAVDDWNLYQIDLVAKTWSGASNDGRTSTLALVYPA